MAKKRYTGSCRRTPDHGPPGPDILIHDGTVEILRPIIVFFKKRLKIEEMIKSVWAIS
ncbi:MAG TPA: hypothetical protein PKZ65_11825 [Methanoregulaceae archaeon]|nr:hypothetical protein [Methanoregulaceae archaeon]